MNQKNSLSMRALGSCRTIVLAATAAMFAPFSGANATLIGDTVTCDVEPASLYTCSSPTAVVGAGVEFVVDLVAAPPTFDIDIGASSISMTNTGGGLGAGAGELLTIGSLNWLGLASSSIIGVANFMTAGTAGMEIGDISFAGDTIMIDFDSGASWATDSYISFDLIFAVPEPAILSLMAIGLLGLGLVRRRRRIV